MTNRVGSLARADRTRAVRVLVAQLDHELTKQVRLAVADFDLTKTQAAVLRELAEPLTQRQIAGALRCEPSNVTFVIDRLENMELAVRTPHPTDRRANLIELTEKGWATRAAMIARFEENSPLSRLSDDELPELERLLARATGQATL
jgi:DNA-binding MarR family transcriptional regulator